MPALIRLGLIGICRSIWGFAQVQPGAAFGLMPGGPIGVVLGLSRGRRRG